MVTIKPFRRLLQGTGVFTRSYNSFQGISEATACHSPPRFFFQERSQQFPLFTEAVRFFSHSHGSDSRRSNKSNNEKMLVATRNLKTHMEPENRAIVLQRSIFRFHVGLFPGVVAMASNLLAASNHETR